MASWAVWPAFQRSRGLGPGDIDLVIWAGRSHPAWAGESAARLVAGETGCETARCLDITTPALALIQALEAARDFVSRTGGAVLVVGDHRGPDLHQPGSDLHLTAAASGWALIVAGSERGEPGHGIGPGSFVPPGEQGVEGLVQAIGREMTGRRPDCLILPHLPPARRLGLLVRLEIDPAASVPLHMVGRHGPGDVAVGLELSLSAGLSAPGSRICLAAGRAEVGWAALSLD